MLQLGIWRELRGEKNQATSLLEQVATNPYYTEFDFASRLASLYLQKRATDGTIEACLALSDVSKQEFDKVVTEPFLHGTRAENSLMIKAWGFAYEDTLCRLYDVIPAETKSHHLTSVEMLSEWLKTLPFPVYQNTPIDLNGDGLEDRLVFLETDTNGGLDVWALLMTANGYVAKYFDYSSSKSDHSEITIIPLDIDGELKALRLSPSVQSYKVISQIQPVQIMVDVNISKSHEQITRIISWDSPTQSFVNQDAIDLALFQMEGLLYVDQYYSSVVKHVDAILTYSNPEQQVTYACGISVAEDFCVDLPEEYAAYFLYMRALALEQIGQVKQARDVYYALWRDYPGNLFGIAASKKLTPVQP